LLAVPAVAGATDVLLPGGSVYRSTDDGVYHWVPNVATANALGVDWNDLVLADELPGPLGDPLGAAQTRTTLGVAGAVKPHVTAVILPNGDVYELNADGSCTLLPDVASANAAGVDWND